MIDTEIQPAPPTRMYEDDLGFVVLQTKRQLDFDYEFRHPGHGDQSVHNPHKGGGGAYAPGGWKPVSETDAVAMRRALAVDKLKGSDRESLIAIYVKDAQKSEATGELYVNGNVQARFPKSMSDKQKQHHLGELDDALAAAPKDMLGNKDFPISVHYGAKGARNAAGKTVSETAETPTGGVTVFVNQKEIKEGIGAESFMTYEGSHVRISSDVTFDQVMQWNSVVPSSKTVKAGDAGFDQAYPWAAWELGGQGKSAAGNTMSHEIGHVVHTFNASKSTRTADMGAVTGAARAAASAPSP